MFYRKNIVLSQTIYRQTDQLKYYIQYLHFPEIIGNDVIFSDIKRVINKVFFDFNKYYMLH